MLALSATRSLRVLLAGPTGDRLIALRTSVEGRPDILVCAEASDGPAALRIALAERPDACLVSDEPGFDAVGVVDVLVEQAPHVTVVLSGDDPDDETLLSAAAMGAAGYVPASIGGAQLAAALFDAASGQPAFPERLAALLIAWLRGEPHTV